VRSPSLAPGNSSQNGITAIESSQPRNSGPFLKELPKRPLLAGNEGIWLSLAGAQDKVGVRLEQGQGYVPLGGAPTRYILKPAVERFDGAALIQQRSEKIRDGFRN
jgi:serine/threonine-protein kinase HipA